VLHSTDESEFNILSNKEKVKSFENLLLYFNKQIRDIIRCSFNIKHEKPRLNNKRRFTAVFQIDKNKLLRNGIEENSNNQSNKIKSNKKIFNLNFNDNLQTSNSQNNDFQNQSSIKSEKNELAENYFLSLKKKTSSFKSGKNLQALVSPTKLDSKRNLNIKYENENKEMENKNQIDIKKLEQIPLYLQIEKKKVQQLFIFYESFINIKIKSDYSNTINNHEILSKNKHSVLSDQVKFKETSKNKTVREEKIQNNLIKDKFNNVKLPNQNNNFKNFEQEFTFFSDLNKYREKNPQKIRKKDRFKLNEVIIYLGFDYSFFLCDEINEQLVVMDIILLNTLNILGSDLAYNILKKLVSRNLSKRNYQLSLEIIKQNIKKALNLQKPISLGFIFFLISKFNKILIKNPLNKKEVIENFENELNKRKIDLLSLNANNLMIIAAEFENNLKPESCFEKRKASFFTFIKSIDIHFDIFSDLLIMTQNIHDYIIFMHIQEKLISEAQYSYRVFLEFRNFLFEYQDKNLMSPNLSNFKSLAAKQLLQNSSRNIANKFYFLKTFFSEKLNSYKHSRNETQINLNKAISKEFLNQNSKLQKNPKTSFNQIYSLKNIDVNKFGKNESNINYESNTKHKHCISIKNRDQENFVEKNNMNCINDFQIDNENDSSFFCYNYNNNNIKKQTKLTIGTKTKINLQSNNKNILEDITNTHTNFYANSKENTIQLKNNILYKIFENSNNQNQTENKSLKENFTTTTDFPIIKRNESNNNKNFQRPKDILIKSNDHLSSYNLFSPSTKSNNFSTSNVFSPITNKIPTYLSNKESESNTPNTFFSQEKKINKLGANHNEFSSFLKFTLKELSNTYNHIRTESSHLLKIKKVKSNKKNVKEEKEISNSKSSFDKFIKLFEEKLGNHSTNKRLLNLEQSKKPKSILNNLKNGEIHKTSDKYNSLKKYDQKEKSSNNKVQSNKNAFYSDKTPKSKIDIYNFYSNQYDSSESNDD